MKIICIGRNYAAHAKELNNDLPTEPVVFLKPDSAILPSKRPFFIPNFSNDIHYEVELVIKIDRIGKHIAPEFAHKYYSEIGLGIDFTARDLQQSLKQKGLPWEKAKAFDGSAVLGEFYPKHELGNLADLQFSLAKNGNLVQQGSSKDMIFSFDQIVSYVSTFFTLKIGDLIFTGTPEGVGPIAINDVLTGTLNGRDALSLKIK